MRYLLRDIAKGLEGTGDPSALTGPRQGVRPSEPIRAPRPGVGHRGKGARGGNRVIRSADP